MARTLMTTPSTYLEARLYMITVSHSTIVMANDTKAPFQDEGHLAPEERDDIRASRLARQ